MDSLDDTENNEVENEEVTDVYFEILSNWGNPNCIGLTEVCKFLSLLSLLCSFYTNFICTVSMSYNFRLQI